MTIDGKIINDINENCSQNINLIKELNKVILTRALAEKLPMNKLKALYLIDSVIKNMD